MTTTLPHPIPCPANTHEEIRPMCRDLILMLKPNFLLYLSYKTKDRSQAGTLHTGPDLALKTFLYDVQVKLATACSTLPRFELMLITLQP
jgi:hypothetical protein